MKKLLFLILFLPAAALAQNEHFFMIASGSPVTSGPVPTFVGVGTTASTVSASTVITYPAGLQAGDMCLLQIGTRMGDITPNTPIGFTFLCSYSGGAGTDALGDQGTLRVSIYYRISDGTESSTNKTISATGHTAVGGAIVAYRKEAARAWDLTFTGGADNVGGQAYSVTATEQFSFSVNDLVLTFMYVNTDEYAFQNHSLSATGSTFSAPTMRTQAPATASTDWYRSMQEFTVVTAGASAAPTYSTSSTIAPTVDPTLRITGPTAFIKLKQQ